MDRKALVSTVDFQNPGLFSIRGSIGNDVHPPRHYVTLIVESLGAPAAKLRDLANEYLEQNSVLLMLDGDELRDNQGGEIVPPEPNPAPDAFQVHIRIPDNLIPNDRGVLTAQPCVCQALLATRLYAFMVWRLVSPTSPRPALTPGASPLNNRVTV